jgi:membrane protein implicated in regulation of membrane protease activity
VCHLILVGECDAADPLFLLLVIFIIIVVVIVGVLSPIPLPLPLCLLCLLNILLLLLLLGHEFSSNGATKSQKKFRLQESDSQG